MKKINSNESNTNNEKNHSFIEERISGTEKIEILYQKMGDRWFTFYLADDELVVHSIPESADETTPNESQKGTA